MTPDVDALSREWQHWPTQEVLPPGPISRESAMELGPDAHRDNSSSTRVTAAGFGVRWQRMGIGSGNWLETDFRPCAVVGERGLLFLERHLGILLKTLFALAAEGPDKHSAE